MDHWSDIFPLIFLPFKFLVLGWGMFYAIKWHYDEDNRKRAEARRRAEEQRLQADIDWDSLLAPKRVAKERVILPELTPEDR
ncbi:MAG: hypothetical protein AAF744_12285 [Pseudomonadota bacterium]